MTTAAFKIKKQALETAIKWRNEFCSDEAPIDAQVTEENFDKLCELVEDEYYDAFEELRCEYEEETGLQCPGHRHYESKSVARLIDGDWIGWTYYYGGGKHGEPGSVDWVHGAYFLNVREEPRIVKVFEKKE